MSELAFADPVFQSQACFRAILRAMSSPGSILACGEGLAPPAGLSPAAAAAILTLVDFETSWWIAPGFPGRDEVAAYVGFHTGAPRAAAPDKAAFALVDTGAEAFDLSNYAQGLPDYPDRSTTLIAQVESLAGGARLRLAGPGVRGVARLAPRPLPNDFVAQWAANRAAFPLGVDLILCAGPTVAALPRSTEVA